MAKTDTKAAARGKWKSILSHLRVSPLVLSGKHVSCPHCGGIDRFRFTDYQGGGEYFCNGCGAGDGFDLLMGVFHADFQTVAKMVDDSLAEIGDAEDDGPFTSNDSVEKRRNSLNSLWREGKDYDIISEYVKRRGIIASALPEYWSADLRGAQSIYLRESREKKRAVLCLVRDVNRKPVSIHRIYVDVGQKLLMPPIGELKGAGIYLGRVKDRAIIGEGVETVLSAMSAFGWPGVAGISANLLQELRLPKTVRNVIVVADNDATFTGQAAAFTVAHRMAVRHNKGVRVVLPRARDSDFNDVIRSDGDYLMFDNEGFDNG